MRTRAIVPSPVVVALAFVGLAAQPAAAVVVPVWPIMLDEAAGGALQAQPAPVPAPEPPKPAKPARAPRPPHDGGKWAWEEGQWKRAENFKISQETTETRTFTVAPGAVLSLNNLSGDITITGSTGKEMRVQVTRRAFGATEADAKDQLERVLVEMNQRGERVEIQAFHKSQMGRARVDFVVAAPAFVVTDIHSKAGDVTLSGLKGEARVDTMSGTIVARDMGALSSARTLSGDIELTNASGSEQFVASTVSGDIRVAGLKVRGCEFGTVSGDVTLNGLSCERAQINTVTGDLSFEGPLDRAGRYEFKTHSGDVRLIPEGKTGFTLDAQTFSGTARSELPLSQRTSGGDTPRGRSQALRGIFGDGSAEITVVTFSGDVTVGRKAQ